MLISISDFARKEGVAFPSVQRVYVAIREGILPPGVFVKIGRRILINEERYNEWLASGGQALPGGWRREVMA